MTLWIRFNWLEMEPAARRDVVKLLQKPEMRGKNRTQSEINSNLVAFATFCDYLQNCGNVCGIFFYG